MNNTLYRENTGQRLKKKEWSIYNKNVHQELIWARSKKEKKSVYYIYIQENSYIDNSGQNTKKNSVFHIYKKEVSIYIEIHINSGEELKEKECL